MTRKALNIIGIILAAAALAAALIGTKGFTTAREPLSPAARNLLSGGGELPSLGAAPSLRGIADWINTAPLSDTDLRGKVVLIDFWTYSCINCVRTIPHVGEWYRKYNGSGLVVVGVHAPEFDFEKKKENVDAAVKKYGIAYPVALDSEHATWDAFKNQYWPAHYLIDARGTIRYRSFGEGHYAETEAAIERLLLEAKLLTLDKVAEVKEPPPDANFGHIGTPEIYLGYLRINNAGNIDPDTKPDLPHRFLKPKAGDLSESRFYFSGTWTIGPEFSELSGEGGGLLLRYKASKAHVVAESRDGREIPVEIILDGKRARTLPVSSPGLYTLAETPDDGWHTLEMRIPRGGFRAFTFTFG